MADEGGRQPQPLDHTGDGVVRPGGDDDRAVDGPAGQVSRHSIGVAFGVHNEDAI